MRYLLLLSSLFMVLAATAQERVFKGRVADKHMKGVPFAVIEAKGRHEGVYANQDGYFAFTANSDSIKALVVTCLGYEKKEVNTDIIPDGDSMLVVLATKVTTLKTVDITWKEAKTAVLGKSRKHLSYEGDCYRYYGSETAIKLRADEEHGNAYLKNVNVFITKDGDYQTRFRVHVYAWGDLPEKELTDSNLIVHAEHGGSWVRVDLSKKQIPVGKGLFVSVEWISGFGNSTQSLSSYLNPEVTGYNGQVLGLTTDYGKPSKTYSRKPFNSTWEYYDSPDAQRKGGYFLNPMIYCTYTYQE